MVISETFVRGGDVYLHDFRLRTAAWAVVCKNCIIRGVITATITLRTTEKYTQISAG